MGYFVAYPSSRGSLHIKDGQDPSAPLDFDTAYCKK